MRRVSEDILIRMCDSDSESGVIGRRLSIITAMLRLRWKAAMFCLLMRSVDKLNDPLSRTCTSLCLKIWIISTAESFSIATRGKGNSCIHDAVIVLLVFFILRA